MRAVNMLLLGSILGLLSGCFSNGPKVMIETPQAEDDFVVVCSWSSHSFGLHGGKSQVKESVFVASSGEVVDCGMSILGDDSRVQIQHPLYRNHSGCTREETCRSSYSRMEGDLLIITPKSKQQKLNSILKTHTGDDLVRAVSGLSGFESDYYGFYASVKKPDKAEFRKKYEERLTKYWETLLPIIYDDWARKSPEPGKITVENLVESRLF